MSTHQAAGRTGEGELRTYAGGIAGGLVGASVMVLVFFAIDAVTGEPLGVFRALAALVGADGRPLVGFLFFIGAGALVWPLLFVTAGRYLPGPTEALRGIVFALVLWVGFLLAFAGPFLADPLPFVAFTLLAHAVYGYLLGFVKEGIAGPAPTE
jgi:hypothetical protein